MNGSNVYATGLTVQAHVSTNATVDRGNGAKDTTKAIETIVGASASDSFYGSPTRTISSGAMGTTDSCRSVAMT